jgi:hypothetical protein
MRVIILSCCLLAWSADVVRGQEQPWYLISERELRSIETYKANSEREKANWLLRVSELKGLAGKSLNKSEDLNRQLSTAREQNRTLQQLYEKSEAEKLALLSLKNGEIAELKESLGAERLRAEKYKGLGEGRLYLIIALAGAWVLYIAWKIRNFFRFIPAKGISSRLKSPNKDI